MPHRSRVSIPLAIAVVLTISTWAVEVPGAESESGSWPSWRGIGSAGCARGGGVYATRWSASEGLAWKTKLPGPGRSS